MAYRDRSLSEGVLSPNLTPLLDIVLQLIVFFMILVHFGTRLEAGSLAVKLPRTPAALPGSDLPLERLVVSVDSSGRLVTDTSILDDESAKVWWASQAKRRREASQLLGAKPSPNLPGGAVAPGAELPTLVIVRADRDASYGAVRKMLATAQEEGFARFSLVVLRRSKP